jgi:hypothetical protein
MAMGIGNSNSSHPSILLLSDPDRLQGGRSRHIWRDRHRHDRLRLELQGLSEDENGAWSSQLNASYRACGCPGAAAGLALALAGYVLFLVGTKGLAASGWPEAGIGLLILGIGSATGKLLGIAWARTRFRRQLERLAALATSRTARLL